MKNNISSSKIYFFLLFSLSFYSFSQTPDILWEHSYGGTNDDRPWTTGQTSDGGYMVIGKSQSFDGDVIDQHGALDYWLIKININGELEWSKSYGSSMSDIPYQIIKTLDEGFVIAGYSKGYDGDVTDNWGNADYWIIKINSVGELIWQKTFGGPDTDIAHSIVLEIWNGKGHMGVHKLTMDFPL